MPEDSILPSGGVDEDAVCDCGGVGVVGLLW